MLRRCLGMCARMRGDTQKGTSRICAESKSSGHWRRRGPNKPWHKFWGARADIVPLPLGLSRCARTLALAGGLSDGLLHCARTSNDRFCALLDVRSVLFTCLACSCRLRTCAQHLRRCAQHPLTLSQIVCAVARPATSRAQALRLWLSIRFACAHSLQDIRAGSNLRA